LEGGRDRESWKNKKVLKEKKSAKIGIFEVLEVSRK
jgi:hypothetical protein